LNNSSDPFVVDRAFSEYTSLVDHNDNFNKSIKILDALTMAKQNGLDLVCFKRGQNGELPFCKILNFGKWKYAEEKKKKKQKQHANKSVVKELRFSPDIDDNDIKHKINQAIEFLKRGDEVILAMYLRGRQKIYRKEAEAKLNQIAALCKDYGEEIKREKTESGIVIRIKKTNVCDNSVGKKEASVSLATVIPEKMVIDVAKPEETAK